MMITDWNLTPEQAIAQQAALVTRVRTENDFGAVNLVAGVDVGFENDGATARAAVVVLTFPALELVEASIARRPVTFPYIPGLLAFRELPVVLDAFEKLAHAPDLIIVDGQGRAHPRRFGIACQLGVLLDQPSIGCAKSILVGRAEIPENRVGAWTPLVYKNETVGAALRTKLNTKRVVNPVYVSIGHRVTLETALDFVLRCCKGYRVPETTRYAHRAASGRNQVKSDQ
ncbi:MAG: deoxyribonuclease V [Chloroflexi bacterium]|nr:deoxyribonuclease V [Chloroflexota bacterium]